MNKDRDPSHTFRMTEWKQHQSVMLEEVLGFLDPKPGQTIVDGTLGLGGHSESILEKLSGSGQLIGFDQDIQAMTIAKKRLERFGDQITFINENYVRLIPELRQLGIDGIDGLILDLGISSLQVDKSERGFSFQSDAPLDMRMNQSQDLTAADVIQTYSEEELARILKEYGEERWHKRIARRIVEERQKQAIYGTKDLVRVVFQALPRGQKRSRIHPATRTFQALRIEVNRELDVLKKVLNDALQILKREGRVIVIAFHSLEDRIVKHTFREWKQSGHGTLVVKKPRVPQEEEVHINPRARSAKLRVFQKGDATT